MPDLKPITVWSLGGSPNPWKAIIVLEELSLPYEVKQVGMAEVKQEPYISLNPNGRVPTIEDPNTGITFRVLSSNLHLGKQGTEYLVGDKCTYADLMFVPYARSLAVIIAPEIDTKVHKRYTEWLKRLYARPAVKKALKQWDDAIALTREEAAHQASSSVAISSELFALRTIKYIPSRIPPSILSCLKSALNFVGLHYSYVK
ncbi:hypothetical protein DL765_007387 [Monosporascus sp. GIB2]|nr:hypothetical protein DL765_007387 [Monosporascus sp. GIB2]